MEAWQRRQAGFAAARTLDPFVVSRLLASVSGM
jgi:hypothetical protein